jgi:indolepyruvate ferredoxin oxidoreductase alpha subunit
MGAGISMAHGMQKAHEWAMAHEADGAPTPAEPRRRVVGLVGDSTFFHSGITGLLDIVYNRSASVIIVADNRTTAMTGHQEHPGTGRTLMGEQTAEVTVEDFGRACRMKNVVTVDPYDIPGTIETLGRALSSEEPWLIVSRAPCPLATRRTVGSARHVDQDLCRKCRLCLKLGCPAIEWVDGGVRVNELLCGGCAMCEKVCKDKAFVASAVAHHE